jgi:molybdopterin-guanine dinucleotide biosynthesis protein A
MQITSIILAGGKSSRMGTDKVLLKVNGKTLLERAIELFRPLCDTILISSNNPSLEKFGYEIIPDEIKDCGPIGGIYSSLKKSNSNWNFVISVDAAFVEADFVQFLISELNGCDAVVPIHSARKEPLIALYNKNCMAEIEKMLKSGNFKMHNLLKEIDTKFVESDNWIEKYPKLFHNLNRPEDL